MATLTAEDLDGGDEEYIRWAGEFKLKERLHLKLKHLRGVSYVHPTLPLAT